MIRASLSYHFHGTLYAVCRTLYAVRFMLHASRLMPHALCCILHLVRKLEGDPVERNPHRVGRLLVVTLYAASVLRTTLYAIRYSALCTLDT